MDWHILALPKEIRNEIFQRLPFRILARCQTVCKQWNNELLSSLGAVDISDGVNTEAFELIMAKMDPKVLTWISFGKNGFVWDLKPLYRFTNIESLSICRSPSISNTEFIAAISQLTNLKSIHSLDSALMPDKVIPSIVNNIRDLTSFYWKGNTPLEEADLRSLSKFTNLESLGLPNAEKDLTDDTFAILARSLTKLNSIQISSEKVSESLIELSRLTNLTEITALSSFFSEKATKNIPTSIKHIEGIFTDKSIENLVHRCQDLVKIQLSRTDSWESEISTKTIELVAHFLPKLTDLTINGIYVTDETLELLHSVSTLTYLHATNCKVSSRALYTLKEKLPNLKFWNNTFIVRYDNNADPYFKYHSHIPPSYNAPIKSISSFAHENVFVAATRKGLWIQHYPPKTHDAEINQVTVCNDNRYILFVDETGRFGIYSVADDEIFTMSAPISKNLTRVTIADSNRMIIVGDSGGKLHLCNTIGQSKWSVTLTDEADNAIDAPVLGLYFLPGAVANNKIVGAVARGVFVWQFERGEELKSTLRIIPTARTLTASAYLTAGDLTVVGDSSGLVTVSPHNDLTANEQVQCEGAVIAISTHWSLPLIAIATETQIVIWCLTGVTHRLAHSSFPIANTARCTAIEWGRSGQSIYVGYSDGTVIVLERYDGEDVKLKQPEEISMEIVGEKIYKFVELYLMEIGEDRKKAGKITGMILEGEELSVLNILINDKSTVIRDLVDEAINELNLFATSFMNDISPLINDYLDKTNNSRSLTKLIMDEIIPRQYSTSTSIEYLKNDENALAKLVAEILCKNQPKTNENDPWTNTNESDTNNGW